MKFGYELYYKVMGDRQCILYTPGNIYDDEKTAKEKAEESIEFYKNIAFKEAKTDDFVVKITNWSPGKEILSE